MFTCQSVLEVLEKYPGRRVDELEPGLYASRLHEAACPQSRRQHRAETGPVCVVQTAQEPTGGKANRYMNRIAMSSSKVARCATRQVRRTFFPYQLIFVISTSNRSARLPSLVTDVASSRTLTTPRSTRSSGRGRPSRSSRRSCRSWRP